METIKTIELILKAIIGIIGWASFFYLVYFNKSNITGDILFGMRGMMQFNGSTNKPIILYLIYPILTNKGKNAISIYDYELEIDFGLGYQRIKKIHKWDNLGNIDLGDLQAPDFLSQLILNKDPLIKHGHLLHGFIGFAIEDVSYVSKSTLKYKLTCIDAFGSKHVIEKLSSKINNHHIFYNLTGCKRIMR